MNCLNPLPMFKSGLSENGRLKYSMKHKNLSIIPDFFVPCGKCILCQQRKSTNWRKRLELEFLSSPESCFITLTYRNEDYSFADVKRDIQTFLKRLRITFSRKGIDITKFKYFIVSELGSQTFRLHYHGILFSLPFRLFEPYIATVKVDEFGKRFPVYSSKLLEKLWKHGFVSLDKCTSKNISYVCKYLMKQGSSKFFSRRIGASLFLNGTKPLKFAKDTFESGKFLYKLHGSPSSSPLFLERYIKQDDEEFYYQVKDKRKELLRNIPPSTSQQLRALADFVDKQYKKALKKEIL